MSASYTITMGFNPPCFVPQAPVSVEKIKTANGCIFTKTVWKKIPRIVTKETFTPLPKTNPSEETQFFSEVTASVIKDKTIKTKKFHLFSENFSKEFSEYHPERKKMRCSSDELLCAETLLEIANDKM